MTDIEKRVRPARIADAEVLAELVDYAGEGFTPSRLSDRKAKNFIAASILPRVSFLSPTTLERLDPVRRILGLVAITVALLIGTAAVVTISPQQAFACDHDHKGV